MSTTKLRAVKMHKGITTRKKVMQLRCELTAEEQRVKGLDLAQQEKAVYDAESEAKKSANEWKEKIQLLSRKLTTSAQILRDGYEWRPIECDEIYDYANGTVRTKRNDTGATVDERPMIAEERQTTFMVDEEEVASTEPPTATR